MTQDTKEHAPQVKESGGLLRHLFGRGGHEIAVSDAHSGPSTKTGGPLSVDGELFIIGWI
jgi:hypothetical protein